MCLKIRCDGESEKFCKICIHHGLGVEPARVRGVAVRDVHITHGLVAVESVDKVEHRAAIRLAHLGLTVVGPDLHEPM